MRHSNHGTAVLSCAQQQGRLSHVPEGHHKRLALCAQVFFIDFGHSISKEECMEEFEDECADEIAHLRSLFVRRTVARRTNNSNESEQATAGSP